MNALKRKGRQVNTKDAKPVNARFKSTGDPGAAFAVSMFPNEFKVKK